MTKQGFVYRKSEIDAGTYEVTFHGEKIGFVRKTTTMSYRGSQGWNRGIRLKDFHPTVWKYKVGEHDSWTRCGWGTRNRAAGELLLEVSSHSKN